jgi:hypothetical protein
MGALQQALMMAVAAAGGPPHRYWRLTNISVTSTDWQPEELQLWTDSSTRADNSGTSLSTDASIVFGTIDRLVDGSVGSFVEFFPMSTLKVIVWDFGSGNDKSVTGFKHADRGGGGVNNALTTARLQYSDDNSSWTTAGDATGIAFSSDVLSSFIPFI